MAITRLHNWRFWMSTIRRALGRTGLMVSPVTLRTMESGSKVGEPEAGKLFRAGARRRVNVFDTTRRSPPMGLL
jgi:hypothetical protein